MAAADETSHAEARLAKPSQASQSREGLTNGIGYFCDGRGQAQGLTTGCGTGYIQFVNGPVDRPTRGGDGSISLSESPGQTMRVPLDPLPHLDKLRYLWKCNVQRARTSPKRFPSSATVPSGTRGLLIMPSRSLTLFIKN